MAILTINQIRERLPHRYPFLLLDRVIELEEGVSCTCIKNISGNEEFFQGHFPDAPVMPGVLILEALAQCGGIAGYTLAADPENSLLLFTGIDKAKFKSPVVPGDQLILRTELVGKKMHLWFFRGKAYVRDENGKEKLAAQAELSLAMADKSKTNL